MANKNKKAFTLVELLAVIVILAVISVIAVPSIMNVINESKKGVLASSAKLIASSAETAYISNQTLGIEKTIDCRDISNYTDEDYASCSIKFVDGIAKVTLVGQGKFEGMAVCGGTKENAEVRNGNDCPVPAVEKIENLFETAASANGLFKDDTADTNIRYTGANPKNYIKFNNENWRIIGIFEMKTSDGNTEKLMKIVRNNYLSKAMSWDSSASGVNNGYGVNQWGVSTYTNGSTYRGADLMIMLNTYYIDENTTCKYCIGSNQSTCSYDCSSSVVPIGSTFVSMIEEVECNLGAVTWAKSITRKSAYDEERGTITGKTCTSGTNCNDTVTRTIKWIGKVGLIYLSDYGYASVNCNDIRDNSSCSMNNWLNGGSYWTLSPSESSSNACYAWHVSSDYVGDDNTYVARNIRPSLYLKSDVSITSGDGSEGNPYLVSMN